MVKCNLSCKKCNLVYFFYCTFHYTIHKKRQKGSVKKCSDPLGPDRNSGPVPVPVEFGLVPVRYR